MRWTRCSLFVLVLALSPAQSGAQMQTTRNLMFGPDRDTADSRMRFLPHVTGWMEVGRGYGSTEEQQAWNVKLGAAAELVRLRNGIALAFVMGHELAASPYSDVGFSPRGAIWDEALLVLGETRGVGWQLGVLHRCRHEIDNDRPYRRSIPREDYEPTRRVTVFTGWHAAALLPEIELGRRVHARALVRFEMYPHAEDNREPDIIRMPDWGYATAGAHFTGRLSLQLRDDVAVYARGWASAVVFREEGRRDSTAEWNRRIEVGARGLGAAGAIDVFIAHEHFFDDLARPTPRSSDVLFVGARLAGRGLH